MPVTLHDFAEMEYFCMVMNEDLGRQMEFLPNQKQNLCSLALGQTCVAEDMT